MRAVTWQGRQDMQVTDVPDPQLQDSTDVIVQITSTGLCGSDLHLYDPLTPFMTPGDVVGHEPMGLVDRGRRRRRHRSRRATGSSCRSTSAAAHCWMCGRGLHSQCETTQNRDQGTGASLFGYSSLYGQVPGGQAEAMRVPFGDDLAHQGAAGSARRPFPLPLRRAADRVAGGRVRRRRRRRHPPGHGRRPDRRHGVAHRAATRTARARGRPGAGAARASGRPWRRDPRPGRHRLPGPAGAGARAHRRPWRGRRDRRGRHGGARLSRRRGCPEGAGAAPQAGAGGDHDQGRGRPARRPVPGAESRCGAAARSRSSASTAGRPTRCR